MTNQKPILYVHSTVLIESILEGIRQYENNLVESFPDANVIFDFNNGLLFERFLINGVPKTYLTDWASSLHVFNPDYMAEIFKWIKEEHPTTKVIAAKDKIVGSNYELYHNQGLIDILLKSDSIERIALPSGHSFVSPDKEEDIATIRKALTE